MGVKDVKLGPKSRFVAELEGKEPAKLATLPDGSVLVAQADAAMRWIEPAAGAAAIGCGCGKVHLPNRDAVVDGHRYGLPCHPGAPDRAGREGDQALPTVGAASVFAEIRRRLDEREATGIRRYGRSLETFNGRDAWRDLEEELLDALAYVTQARMEHRATVEALIAVAGFLKIRGVDAATASAKLKASLELAEKLEALKR